MNRESQQDRLDKAIVPDRRREPTGVQGEPSATSAVALSVDSSRCSATTKMGLSCGGRPMTGKDRCFQHFASMEERSEAGRRGGLASKLAKAAARLDAPSFATAEGTRAYLEKASAAVAAGRIAPSQAKAIAQFASLGIELAKLQLERDLLDAELEQQGRRNSTPSLIDSRGSGR
jgi:hypothetical protein